jgi:hypothetical protein
MQQLIIIMEDSKTLFWSSKFPQAHERISLKFIDNMGTHFQKGLPALPYTLLFPSITLVQSVLLCGLKYFYEENSTETVKESNTVLQSIQYRSTRF